MQLNIVHVCLYIEAYIW